jgi:hypothetical protein
MTGDVDGFRARIVVEGRAGRVRERRPIPDPERYRAAAGEGGDGRAPAPVTRSDRAARCFLCRRMPNVSGPASPEGDADGPDPDAAPAR